MEILRKVTFTDGSVLSSYGHGHWIPIPEDCVPMWVLDQLHRGSQDKMLSYAKQDVDGQGVFEYFRIPQIPDETTLTKLEW